jgi:hypothetical protein
MPRLPKLLREHRVPDAEVQRAREAVELFLVKAPIEESALMIDGPGIGCAGHLIILGLLGMERLKKMAAVHSFSSSGYGPMLLAAKEQGQLVVDRDSCYGWDLRNIQRHKIRPIQTLVESIGQKLKGEKFIFDNLLAEDALLSMTTTQFGNTPLSQCMPSNFHYWSYCQKRKEFFDHNSAENRAHWTPVNTIRAMTAVPQIYEAYEKDSCTYTDALLTTRIRDHFRQLRSTYSNVFFWHMRRDAEVGNTLFFKGHDDVNGTARVVIDFVRFMSGIPNPEVDAALRTGLFDLEPL